MGETESDYRALSGCSAGFYIQTKGKVHTEQSICSKIYGKSDKKSIQSFRRLLNRFKSKLYESLTLDVNIYRPESYAESTQYRIELRKLVIYFTALRGKLINQEFVRLMERAIYLAKKYELYYDIVNLLNAKIEILSFVSSYDKVQKIEREIIPLCKSPTQRKIICRYCGYKYCS